MTRSALAIAIASLFASLGVLAQQVPTSPDNAAVTTSTGSNNAISADTTNRSDEKFLKNFAEVNAAAVAMSKLAAEKSETLEVQVFAKHMIDEHSKTIANVEAIASQTKVDVKARPAFAHKAKSAMINVNVGGSFDRAFMKAMIDDHEKAIEMLQREIRDGQDASVKQLASQALADDEEHLKMAQELRAKISDEQYVRTASSRSKSNSQEKLAASP